MTGQWETMTWTETGPCPPEWKPFAVDGGYIWLRREIGTPAPVRADGPVKAPVMRERTDGSFEASRALTVTEIWERLAARTKQARLAAKAAP